MGCQFRKPMFSPPSYPHLNLSMNSRSSGSVGMRPPLTLAYLDRWSYEEMNGQCFANLSGIGPYSVRTCPRNKQTS